MDSTIKALVSGMAVKQAARGAQEKPFMADQRLFSCTVAVSPGKLSTPPVTFRAIGFITQYAEFLR